ncbi:MAG: Re/Si-specific NAD(P)(+) transhydrogenase subunit alpha [Bacteroidia bacterium]
MIIAVPKETELKENRVALSPDGVKELTAKGFEIIIEENAGLNSYFSNEAYIANGAKMVSKQNIYAQADVVLKVNPPEVSEVQLMKPNAILISFMYAAVNNELVAALANKNITSFSVDAIPRISRAQKMDALSSQANLAGYKAVILAANHLGKIFPMLMTAAGTIKPAKVVIMGAGVAGLQAIATAKRLGAIVEVSDIRPETKEQVESLGGKFIEVKGDTSVKMEGGYVTGVSEDFLAKQQELIAKHIAQADIVITTALIPGRKAPVLISEEMVKSMKMGSVVLDMAVKQGGNCAISEFNQTVQKHGVTIIGEPNLPALLPLNASELYSKNIIAFLTHLADKDKFHFDMEEEITKGSLITHKGEIVHPSAQPKPVNA